jgi:5'-nucleotidase
MAYRILLSNDDGIDAPGLFSLREEIVRMAEVTIVAPLSERSAVGHAISVFNHLSVQKRFKDDKLFGYALDGTPADCVKLGVTTLMSEAPHLVIAGINRGQNTGNSILYSGTVAAAIEGTMFGVPSFAISVAARRGESCHFAYAAKFAARLARCVIEKGLPKGVLLNVNVPNVPEEELRGVVISRQGQSMYVDVFEGQGEKGEILAYRNTGEEMIASPEGDDADDVVLQQNKISITPLHYDLTFHQFRKELEKWMAEHVCPDISGEMKELSRDLEAEYRE